MPRSSDDSERVLNLLSLFELLRKQQAGSKLEEPVNLLSLAGARSLRPSRQARRAFDEAVRLLGRPTRTNVLDLVIAGVEVLLEMGVPDVELTPTLLEGAGMRFQRASRPIPAPVAPVASVSAVRKVLRDTPLPVPIPLESPIEPKKVEERTLFSPRTRELICAFSAPPLLKVATAAPHPIIKGAAIAALVLCGFEFTE